MCTEKWLLSLFIQTVSDDVKAIAPPCHRQRPVADDRAHPRRLDYRRRPVGLSGLVESPERLTAKLEAAGFNVVSIDGHNPAQIQEAFDAFAESAQQADAVPTAIVAKTIKGWGTPSLQGGGWHGKPAVDHVLIKAIDELDERRVELTSALNQEDTFEIKPPAQAPSTSSSRTT